MRMMMKVSMPVEAANKGLVDGSLPKMWMGFIERYKPEAAYFCAVDGKRTGILFLDISDPSLIPSLAEPFFQTLNASIELTPAMNAQEMRAGVEKAMKK